MAVVRRDLLDIIKDAGADIGVLGGIAALNSDTTEQRMINGALRRTAVELCTRGLLLREHTFYTVSGQADYTLPSDYFLPWMHTAWNRSDKWPMRSVNQREWQADKSGFIASSVHQRYQVKPIALQPGTSHPDHFAQRRFHIDPTPTSAEQVAFNYRSDYLFAAADLAAITVTGVTLSGTDEVLIDTSAVVHAMEGGNLVGFYDVAGVTGLNGNSYSVSTVPSTTTLTLLGTNSEDFIPSTTSVAVEGITLSGSNPVQIDSTGHGMSNGDQVVLQSVGGTTEVNGKSYVIESVAADTFDLAGTDSTNFTAWTSGGTYVSWTPAGSMQKVGNIDDVTSTSGVVWYPLVPDEVLELGVAWRLRQRMGMSYFEHKDEYERLVDTFVGATFGEQRVNMSSAPRNNYVGIPEGNFTSN